MTANKELTTVSAPLTDEDGEVRELTEEDFAGFKPSHEVPEVGRILQKHGRLGRPPLPADQKKRRVTLHLDPDVIDTLKEGGKGWQTRANAALRKALGL